MVQQGSILDRTRTPVSDQLEPLVVVDILDDPFDDTLETVHDLPERVVRCGIWLSPRGLAGKPLAGFYTTPSRRITVVYGVIVYAIRFKNPSLHR